MKKKEQRERKKRLRVTFYSSLFAWDSRAIRRICATWPTQQRKGRHANISLFLPVSVRDLSINACPFSLLSSISCSLLRISFKFLNYSFALECGMKVPVGFLAKLWSFLSFLPFFFMLFLLGLLKGMKPSKPFFVVFFFFFKLFMNMEVRWLGVWTRESGPFDGPTSLQTIYPHIDLKSIKYLWFL